MRLGVGLVRVSGMSEETAMVMKIWFGVGLFGWMATTFMVVEMRTIGYEVSEVSSLTSQRPQLLFIGDRRFDLVGGCL